MSETELSVVCKSCGAEVSPYVTECPYCGARVRKRAPDLERRDGGLEAKQSRRERRRLKKQRERVRRQSNGGQRTIPAIAIGVRPWATLSVIAIPVVAMLVRIAIGSNLADFGAAIAPLADQWWRFLTAPFAYDSVGYLFVVGLALAIFGPGTERRLGTVAALILFVACGSLGALAAFGIENARGAVAVISGGNGIALGTIAAWYFTARPEAKATGESLDAIGVVVATGVVLLLPAVVDGADFWAGVAGGLVGMLAGLAAARFARG